MSAAKSSARGSVLGSLLTIIGVGAIAALCAYGAMFALGLSGVIGGVVAVLVAMVIALPLFAVAVRMFRRPRS